MRAAAEALADVVVGVAFEFEGHALRHEGAEALAGAAVEVQMHGVVGQALPVALGDLVAEDGADDAVDVADRQRGADFFAALEGGFAEVEQRGDVERLLEAVILRLGAEAADFGADRRLVEDLARSRGPSPSNARRPSAASSTSVRPTISLSVRKPSCAMSSRTSCAMNFMKFTRVLGIAGEVLAQLADPAWRRRPGRCSDGRRAS